MLCDSHCVCAAATLCVSVSAAVAQVGPCQTGYLVEEVALPTGVMDWSLSDDGTAFVNSRLYRPGVGEIESPSVFYPRAMSASGLMAGFPIADGSVATSFARVSLATVDGVLATYDYESFGGGFGIFDLSDSGWIVGTFGVWGSAVPARILPSGELEILEVPEGMTGYALAVNNSGQTAGRLQHVTGARTYRSGVGVLGYRRDAPRDHRLRDIGQS